MPRQTATRPFHLTALLLATVTGALTGTARAADWPHWRGVARSGVVDEDSGFDRGAWPPGKPAWTAKLGLSGSAPIVADGRLYTMGWKDDREWVHCLEAATGKPLWTQSYPCPLYGRKSEGDKGLYSGPSSCPSFDKQTGYLYTLSTDGDLNCWDTRQSGRHVWRLNFYEAYDVAQRPLVGRRRLRDYGYTTAPLIHGDWVIVEVGDDEGNLMAFSKKTGKRVWASESRQPAGHSGGLSPMTVDGIPCVAVLTIRNLLVARLDKGHEGQTLATFPWITDFGNNIATPVIDGQSVVITSAYNKSSVVRLEVSRKGIRQVWKAPYAADACSPVLHQGRLYLIRSGLTCLDYKTGQLIWRAPGFGLTASCVFTSDHRLIVWANRGDLVLVESSGKSPKAYKELARKSRLMKSDAWPHVVLSNGRLFCKDWNGVLMCFKL